MVFIHKVKIRRRSMIKETEYSAKICAEEGIYGDRMLYNFLNGSEQGRCISNIKIIIIN